MQLLKLGWTANVQLRKELIKLISIVHLVSCAERRAKPPFEHPPPIRDAAAIDAAFREHEIIPDILSKAPKNTLQVSFCREYYVDFGNHLVPNVWEQKPTRINFKGIKKDRMYVLVMTGLDYPTRARPAGREWWFWVYADILGGIMKRGKNVMVYIGPAQVMRHNTGIHRIAFLLMEQKDGRIWYEEKHLMPSPKERFRSRHNLTRFIEKYNLSDPVAGNFFTSGYVYPTLKPENP